MTQSRPRSAACHNCRQRRLKCDQSLPQCLKCIKRGHECLGYQRLFRWDQGIASRGKMAGKTFEDVAAEQVGCKRSGSQLSSQPSPGQRMSRSTSEILPHCCLVDPLLQDLDHASRKYLLYCELPLFSRPISH